MKRLIGLVTTVLMVSAGASAAVSAQSASSPGFFMPCSERASGGGASSITYRLEAVFGTGVVPQLATSPGFRLLGGFNACSDTPIAGQVWASGVLPLFGPITGGTAHTIHGHNMNAGLVTNVTIGGQAALVSTRSQDNVTVTLPAQTAPGWQPVVVNNSNGTATISRGIGILPMADSAPPAIENTQPFRVTYRGRQGDIFYLVVASAKLPGAVPIGPYNYGLELNLGALVGPLIGPFPVTSPSGEFHLDFPGINFPRPLFVQMLGVAGGGPYAPGGFTNVLSL